MPGEAFALFSALAFAAASVAVAKGVVHRGGDNGALLSVIITAFSAAGLWLAFGSPSSLQPTGGPFYRGLAWFAFSGLLTIFLGRNFLYRSIEHLGAIRSSALKRLNPLFAVLLGAVILGEVISAVAGAGMLLIVASFGLLLQRSLGALRASAPTPAGRMAAETVPRPIGYAYGSGSAFAYSLGYVARRFGLDALPDSNFGTFVSALAGLASFGIAALFLKSYRRIVLGVFRYANRWQVVAGVMASAGQLSQFAAIQRIEVSRVAMISSIEIVLSMIIAVYVLKTERRPDARTLTVAGLATAGVILVAAG